MIADLQNDWKELLPKNFSPDSRVWIYQCSRMLRIQEALQAEAMLNDFVENWHSHGTPVKGFAILMFGQFVIIMADETGSGVSGCSTDSSVRVIKEMEKTFQVSFFDRTTLAFLINNKVELLPLTHLNAGLQAGKLHSSTLYFNNLVNNYTQLMNEWIVPIEKSWLKHRLQHIA